MKEAIFEEYCQVFRGLRPLRWVRSQPTEADLRWIEKEATDDSPFDPAGLRRAMLAQLNQLVCWQDSAGNRVMAIGAAPDANWSLAFQAFGRGPYRVCWLAHPAARLFPPSGHEVGPGSLNGGYTLPCDGQSIFIYRKEEGLRVLLHELLHATCTDNHNDHLPVMEAKTEAWAEVILCCLLARGSLAKALRLWHQQAGWILAQTARLIESHGVRGPDAYAWRYTVGKKEYLEGWGLLEKAVVPRGLRLTTRLTSPALL